jgi:hypothetical protein
MLEETGRDEEPLSHLSISRGHESAAHRLVPGRRERARRSLLIADGLSLGSTQATLEQGCLPPGNVTCLVIKKLWIGQLF